MQLFARSTLFAVVMEGLSKFVDGEHYFDTLDDVGSRAVRVELWN
jgi:hypothetical protein